MVRSWRSQGLEHGSANLGWKMGRVPVGQNFGQAGLYAAFVSVRVCGKGNRSRITAPPAPFTTSACSKQLPMRSSTPKQTASWHSSMRRSHLYYMLIHRYRKKRSTFAHFYFVQGCGGKTARKSKSAREARTAVAHISGGGRRATISPALADVGFTTGRCGVSVHCSLSAELHGKATF